MGMSAVDQLLAFLVGGKSRVASHMVSAGFTESEIREAWESARALGYTESTGLGQDRLTNAGAERARTLAGR